jgi:hypothetical protein
MTSRRRTGLILAGIAGTLLIVFVFIVPVLMGIATGQKRSPIWNRVPVSTGKIEVPGGGPQGQD